MIFAKSKLRRHFLLTEGISPICQCQQATREREVCSITGVRRCNPATFCHYCIFTERSKIGI
ncbi:hypothetical protein B0O99DRAFT_631126 [Bisporella sp. PMI_857]|nr:hypothetical protein B0O99DRAFT_631126 [Bisporella sp. PMI_857]